MPSSLLVVKLSFVRQGRLFPPWEKLLHMLFLLIVLGFAQTSRTRTIRKEAAWGELLTTPAPLLEKQAF
jgi:hypothetical protein